MHLNSVKEQLPEHLKRDAKTREFWEGSTNNLSDFETKPPQTKDRATGKVQDDVFGMNTCESLQNGIVRIAIANLLEVSF